MNLLEFAKNNMLVLDGAMGTMLQSGFDVNSIHKAYLEAGANIILTNTFSDSSDENIALSVKIAKNAAVDYDAYVGADIAPTGQFFEPLGKLGQDEAYDIFKRQVLAAYKAGADAIYIETFSDLLEAEIAVLAAKENCSLPIFCTMTFDANMRTFMGVDIPSMAHSLTEAGVDFLGINCSVGPAEMKNMAAELMRCTHLPVVIKPNAGLPSMENGNIVYHVTPEGFAQEMAAIADLGVAGIGGCCGTTPAFIEKLADIAREGLRPRKP
ncbi:MAG: homocysteine S-methyltransferase family protein [Oscillospiraceae bacterium]|nr:homocysteine S-methyltransferase family protein [Oscillospiraceae bacterium]